MYKFTELKETESVDIDFTYDDQMYSTVDDVIPSNLKTYQAFTPTTLNSPSLYMVPVKKRPDELQDSNMYEEINNHVHNLETAMPHCQQPFVDNNENHFDMDDGVYTEMT